MTEKVLHRPITDPVETNKEDETQTKTLCNQKCLNELFTEYNRKRLPRRCIKLINYETKQQIGFTNHHYFI